MKIGNGSCNGTFGELVQGVIDERPFLITFPIQSLRSEASFIPDPTSPELTGVNSKVKAIKAGKLLLNQFGLNGGGKLEIRSNIPKGKGMASSSADIVASLKAIAHSYSLPITQDIISTIATKIEPTDGVMYDEVVAYDYIHGDLMESFGDLPPFILVGIDLGGAVNTIEFNQFKKAYDRYDQHQFSEAYHWVREGFSKNEFSLIGKATTISARVNQKILRKPYFFEMEKLAHAFQGGIVVAHSGTVVGILIDKNRLNSIEIVFQLSKHLSHLFKNLKKTPFYYSNVENVKNINFIN